MRRAISVTILSALCTPGPAMSASPEELKAICTEAAQRYEEMFGQPQVAAPQPVVAMFKHTFCPLQLTVKQGSTVRFVNVDRRTTHSFWFRDAGRPESDRIFSGEGTTMTIDLPVGEHVYLCGPHWENEKMIGRITVTP